MGIHAGTRIGAFHQGRGGAGRGFEGLGTEQARHLGKKAEHEACAGRAGRWSDDEIKIKGFPQYFKRQIMRFLHRDMRLGWPA